ncbi:hypothetical protein CP533_6917 [Ophiocordyceps camponoti-saundersi (nom. inval.)]|nr:hypothetical protein CP533_6917 [Ophiocordyceps camponoti-saundersi (nom. inval.)]
MMKCKKKHQEEVITHDWLALLHRIYRNRAPVLTMTASEPAGACLPLRKRGASLLVEPGSSQPNMNNETESESLGRFGFRRQPPSPNPRLSIGKSAH